MVLSLGTTLESPGELLQLLDAGTLSDQSGQSLGWGLVIGILKPLPRQF